MHHSNNCIPNILKATGSISNSYWAQWSSGYRANL